MKSVRLTESDRAYIVCHITDPLNKEIQEILNKFGKEVVTPIIKEKTPQEIRDFDQKYPGLIRKEKTLAYQELFKKRNWISLYIPIEGYYPQYFERPMCEVLSCTETEVVKDVVEKLLQKCSILSRKTRCVLETIKTTKQLKDSFPEAFSILMDQEEKEEENKCDSIENLRAELSAFNK